MKIVLAPVGSRGDVQPMIALGVGLQRAGHDVTLCTAENFRDAVDAQGLRYVRGGRDAQALVAAHGDSVRNPLTFLKIARLVQAEQCELLATACEGADLLVGTMLLTAGPSVAEKLGIPFVWASYFPNTFPTMELPSPAVSAHVSSRILIRLSWWAQRVFTNVGLRKTINTARASWGLAPVKDMFDHALAAGEAMLALDPGIAQVPSDVPVPVHVTGCWFLDSHERIPDDVDAFIRAGTPPVYIGFGSMPVRDPVQRTRIIVDAVKAVGCRALISKGWGGLGDGVNDAQCMAVGPINHMALFPRMLATVHHGGAGTTSASARAGIPQVVVPHMFDQFYWATRVEKTGIGTTLRSHQFTSAELADALRKVTTDGAIKQAASAMGASLRASDGVGEAVRVIERIAARSASRQQREDVRVQPVAPEHIARE